MRWCCDCSSSSSSSSGWRLRRCPTPGTVPTPSRLHRSHAVSLGLQPASARISARYIPESLVLLCSALCKLYILNPGHCSFVSDRSLEAQYPEENPLQNSIYTSVVKKNRYDYMQLLAVMYSTFQAATSKLEESVWKLVNIWLFLFTYELQYWPEEPSAL